MAHLAGHVHVRQEVHLNFQHTVAGAGLAAAATGVEGEAAGAVATGLGVGQGGEEITDVVEEIGVGGGVGTGGAADGTLVDVDDLIQVFQPLDGIVLAGVGLHAVEGHAQLFIEDLVDERGFAAAADAGDAGEGAQGDGHVHVLQVVLPGAPDGEPFTVADAAVGRHLDAFFAA